MEINESVLVLDKAYMPLNIVPAKKALTYLIKEKAVVIEETDKYIASGSNIWQVPSVIKLSDFLGQTSYSKIKVKFNKKTLLERDNYACQYCDKPLSKEHATVDHVIPKGGNYNGKTSWTNCVIACQPCNSRKGNKTPEEAGMRLAKEPKYPHYMSHMSRILKKHIKEKISWKQYFIS